MPYTKEEVAAFAKKNNISEIRARAMLRDLANDKKVL